MMDKSPSDVLRAAGRDAHPFALFGAWSHASALVGSDPLVVSVEAGDPFSLLDEQPEITATVTGATGGGWIGYLGYGLGRLVERLPDPPPRPVAVPGSILAFYDHLLARDQSGNWWFEALWSKEQSERLAARLSEWRRRAGEPAPEAGEFELGTFVMSPSYDRHLASVSRAIEHIRSGDVFQVNVCTRLEADFSGDPVELFCQGADRLAPRYGAFLGHPSVAVASFSPELFLRQRGHRVLSSPIKGTAPRDGSPENHGERLLGSDKDRAENVMIVDLVRNDLGRVCRYGTVAVPELCRLEEHPGLWHLVSDVTGEMCEGISVAGLLRATFPPGSVTGAPKVRAMELVTELEGTAREIYTGAIGIASPLTGLELNVAIRTFELAGNRAWLGVGGGIVSDSDPRRELEECFDKVAPLLAAVGGALGSATVRARTAAPTGARTAAPTSAAAAHLATAHADPALGVFETVLVLDGRLVDLESHLGRLAASVSCLYGSQLPARLGAEVGEAATGRRGPERLRVRVCPGPSRGLVWEISIVPASESFSGSPGSPVVLVPFVLAGGLGGHKWQDRRLLADRREALGLGGHDQLLLVDGDRYVLETEQANVFAAFGDVVRTPPLDGRILAGTTRERVIRLTLANGLVVSEEPLCLDELGSAEEAFVTSSIRGLCPVGALGRDRSFETGPIGAMLAKDLWKAWHSAGTGGTCHP
jgi:para-aminobenzoate synthetase/4-amino-4-deoxychorismate lyase